MTSPDKAAVIMAESGRALTYRELDQRSHRLARFLYDNGLRHGDHVALLSDNRLEYLQVYWAALRSGLYVTPINRHLAADEITYIVNDCGATVAFVASSLPGQAEAIAAGSPRVRLRLAIGGRLPGYDSYEAAVASTTEPLPSQPRGGDMMYSSGTTGRPKGIKRPLPEGYFDDPSPGYEVLRETYEVSADSVYLSPAPLYHAAPLRYSAGVQALGGTVVVMEKFDPEAALAAIARYRVTHSQWVPTMFTRMLKLDDSVRREYDVSSMRVAVHAAAPCPVEVKRAMMDWWGPILYEYYGATEGNGTTAITPAEWLLKPGSVGRAATGVIHVCDDEGQEVPAGETGTIYFEAEQAFEYYNDAAKTRDATHPRHPLWSTMGDIGYLDDDGYLFLTDRKAFMIISGGVNIYPQEIENALVLHQKVLDVAVIGVPDPEMGESVKAVIETAEGVVPGPELAEELRAYLRARLAHFKVPRTFEFVGALPRTPTGKLLKREIRDQYR